jgi:hypothetical protein
MGDSAKEITNNDTRWPFPVYCSVTPMKSDPLLPILPQN